MQRIQKILLVCYFLIKLEKLFAQPDNTIIAVVVYTNSKTRLTR